MIPPSLIMIENFTARQKYLILGILIIGLLIPFANIIAWCFLLCLLFSVATLEYRVHHNTKLMPNPFKNMVPIPELCIDWYFKEVPNQYYCLKTSQFSYAPETWKTMIKNILNIRDLNQEIYFMTYRKEFKTWYFAMVNQGFMWTFTLIAIVIIGIPVVILIDFAVAAAL
ncbi:unnamed protein product [Blepharisma stoltei]|uniref:Uncharacterized protein n=1 Tax=Blepharisma stoltei TaxID=1481888 RepID=A0AAU9IL04_9CILI|nr:unnamed protein product [Blepharisma stoltei]